MTNRDRTVGRALLGLVAGVALSVVQVAAGPAGAQRVDEPAATQTIDRDQPVRTGRAVLADGHADIGPRFVDGNWRLLIHDDATFPSSWRSPEETVIKLGSAAIQTVPDNPTYSFLGVAPNSDVFIVPQVQRPGVVWLGWNTQDPGVMESIDRGATLTLLGVEGPGSVSVYLQSGVLGPPEVLWQSAAGRRQSIFVEVNSHSHANWVFTRPGVYLVQVEVTATLTSGRTVRDVRALRFAVGDTTSTDLTFAAPAPPDPGPPQPDERASVPDDGGSSGGPGVMLALVAAAAMLAAVATVVVRSSGAKRKAEEERLVARRDGRESE